MKSKREIVVALGNLIMGSGISKEDKEIIFDAYKLLGDYIQADFDKLFLQKSEESGFSKFAKAMAKREEDAEYIKWRDEYVEQMTWFYKFVGFPDAHAIGDTLYIGSNDTLGYNLRNLYRELQKEDKESEQ